MRRLAYASPVNPVASGISDYSEELLPYLGQYAEITLYVADGVRPTNPQLARHISIRTLNQLMRDQRRKPFDAILYQIGNSPAHLPIWRACQQLPGVVVLHEFVLHHFMLQYYATQLGDIDAYQAEMARRYGPAGTHSAALMMRGRFTEAAFDFPFCEDVVAVADGLLAHSQYVLNRVASLRPELPTALVPMGVPLPALLDCSTARASLGLPQGVPILASFGHINPYKRVEPALRAIRTLLPDYPDLRYILVGSVSPNFNLQAAVERSGMAKAVTVTGYLPREQFEAYVAAADICLNLRHPTAGETSASLLRLLGAGRPTLVTATGSFTELPASVAAQVDPDAAEEQLIAGYCRLLLRHPELADQLGSAARQYVAREHTLAGAAQRIMQFLAQRYGWEPPARYRPTPLWDVEEHTSTVATRPLAPPVSPTNTTIPASHHLTASAASAITGLGIANPAHPLLQRTATALAELGVGAPEDLARPDLSGLAELPHSHVQQQRK